MIAERLNVSLEDVREIDQAIQSRDLRLDGYVNQEESTTYLDTLSTAEELIDEKLARGELKKLFNEKLREFAQSLNKREKTILKERLIAENPKTLQRIGDQFGVTREAVRLSEKALVAKIKKYMHDALKGVTEVEFGLIG